MPPDSPALDSGAKPHHAVPRTSAAWQYTAGGLAGMGACIFTNPIEVVKTRMQVQVRHPCSEDKERNLKRLTLAKIVL